MTAAQIDAVKELLDLCFGSSAWSRENVRSQLEKSDATCTVAVENGTIVGYLAFEQIEDEGSIVELAVHPDHRRQGIARELVRAALDNYFVKEIYLEVRESNTPAISLYENLGFEKIGVRKGYYDNPKEDAVLMKKPSP